VGSLAAVVLLSANAFAALEPAASTATVAASTSTISASTAPAATLVAVGDIRLDGPVGAIIARLGPGAPTADIREPLAADIVFGNLEGSITRRGEKQPKTWNFRAPPKNLACLKEAGFTVLNVANNHTMDFGREGFEDTVAAVRKRGFLLVGGGRDRQEAEALRIARAGSLKVGFLGFTSTFPQEAWAKRHRPGVAYSDFDRFPAIIRAARPLCDVLVVSFHGGTELAPEPNEIQKSFARAAIEAGADLVIGHHPHVLQAVEVYRGKPILYSLGNFLFVSPNPDTRATVIARAALTPSGVRSIEFVPVDGNWGRPRRADAAVRQAALQALDRLGAISSHPELFTLSP
jgi:poly-gamma-glutamate synthesis protein (capsule biosynthesis protein)